MKPSVILKKDGTKDKRCSAKQLVYALSDDIFKKIVEDNTSTPAIASAIGGAYARTTYWVKRRIEQLGLTTDHFYLRFSKEKSILSVKYGRYQAAAKKRGIPFELSATDAFKMFQENCFYCCWTPCMHYESIHKNTKSFRGMWLNGIDRVDNSLGYTLENCVPCCTQCNRGKLTYTQEEFTSQVKKIFYQHVSGIHTTGNIPVFYSIPVRDVEEFSKGFQGAFLEREYIKSAKKRGVPFYLTPYEIAWLTSHCCYYCGSPPAQRRKKDRGAYVYNGIDRKECTEGYTIGNCVPCCKQCNFMKAQLPTRQFLCYVSHFFMSYFPEEFNKVVVRP